MPRILRILNRFNLGGPTYNAAYLTRYLNSDFETMLIGGPNDPTEKNSEYIVRQLGVQPDVISHMRRELSPANDFLAFQEIRSIIRQFKPDIVHTHASKAGALGRHAALSMKVPVIVHTFHGHVFDAYFSHWKTTVYKSIERYLASKSDRIIAISDIQKHDLSVKYNICSPDKISVIPLGFDLSKFRENHPEKRYFFRKQYQIADDEIAIGIVGRLVPVKNHEMFLKAIRILKAKTNQKIRAFIIGDGELRDQVEAKAKELGIDYATHLGEYQPATLTFTSWITQMDYVNAGLDIVALTSRNEGTPVSLIEAQAAGTPIVTTAVGGIENVVVPNQTALLTATDDAEDFAAKLQLLAENEDLRYEFSQNGWSQVGEKFHYTRLVQNMENLYYELLEQKQQIIAKPLVA
jgi:glycosyltransferase involved in cell wall biosynthesis